MDQASIEINLILENLMYFCHEVGNGNVKPNVAKVASIGLFPPPTDHKSLMRSLGMAGFFRRFCKNLLM